jgi:hypothetical protein
MDPNKKDGFLRLILAFDGHDDFVQKKTKITILVVHLLSEETVC